MPQYSGVNRDLLCRKLEQGKEEIAKLFDKTKENPYRALCYLRDAYLNEFRQPKFYEFIHAFYGRNIRSYHCQLCVRQRACFHGVRHGYQCITYYRWHMGMDEEAHQLKACVQQGITEEYLLTLTHIQLLGILYFSGLTLETVVDFSKVGLRSRILSWFWIEKSPYLLTGE